MQIAVYSLYLGCAGEALEIMKRKDFVLASMSPAGNESFSPVQVQKLFFLLDKHIAKFTGGPYFRFIPYDYGPFDKKVYTQLDRLSEEGLVELLLPPVSRFQEYRLTDRGYEIGARKLKTLSEPIQDYIGQLVNWVRSQSFAALVSAIYRAYPEMRENSVFRDHA